MVIGKCDGQAGRLGGSSTAAWEWQKQSGSRSRDRYPMGSHSPRVVLLSGMHADPRLSRSFHVQRTVNNLYLGILPRVARYCSTPALILMLETSQQPALPVYLSQVPFRPLGRPMSQPMAAQSDPGSDGGVWCVGGACLASASGPHYCVLLVREGTISKRFSQVGSACNLAGQSSPPLLPITRVQCQFA